MDDEKHHNFDDICEKENQPFFVDCLKKFVLFEMDHANGFQLEVKNDWTGFRRRPCGFFTKQILDDYEKGKNNLANLR